MTTGNVAIGNSSPSGQNADCFYKRKVWSGVDGRFELDGVTRKINPYSSTFTSRSGNCSLVSSGFPTPCDTGTSASNWDARYYNMLLSELVSEVKGHDFNLGVNLGTAHQTIALVASNASKLSRGFMALKRGNIPAALRSLGVDPKGRKLRSKDISAQWLELQYGWLPLINDCYESMVAYSSICNKPRQLTVRVRQATRKVMFESSDSPSNYSGLGVSRTVGHLVYYMQEDFSLSAPRSLGLYDPLSIAWELVPFSFVVDWFIPIGTYLENLNTIPFLKGRLCLTLVHKCDSRQTKVINPTFYKGARWRQNLVITTRSAPNLVRPPLPSFKSMSGAASPAHVKNAIALLHQAFK